MSPGLKRLPARFYRLDSGHEPVREWLEKLTPADRKLIGEDIRDVEFAWPIGMPLVRSMGNGLWEVRSSLTGSRIARVIGRAGFHGAGARLYQEDSGDSEAGLGPGSKTQARGWRMKKKNIGSSFDSWLREEGIYEEVSATAIKRVLARQLEAAMEDKGLSKSEMARRMNTSRAALSRLLDPENDSVTLNTLQKAATVIGREVRLELV